MEETKLETNPFKLCFKELGGKKKRHVTTVLLFEILVVPASFQRPLQPQAITPKLPNFRTRLQPHLSITQSSRKFLGDHRCYMVFAYLGIGKNHSFPEKWSFNSFLAQGKSQFLRPNLGHIPTFKPKILTIHTCHATSEELFGTTM